MNKNGTYDCCKGCTFQVSDLGTNGCRTNASVTVCSTDGVVGSVTCNSREEVEVNPIKELTLGIIEYLELELDSDEVIDLYDTVEAEDSDDFTVEVGGMEVRVIAFNSIDAIWEEELESMLTECYDIPKHLENYIDYEKWVRDCKYDGLGHHFNPYNGTEFEVGEYHLFRTN